MRCSSYAATVLALVVLVQAIYNSSTSANITSTGHEVKNGSLLNVLAADLKFLQRSLADGSLQSVDLVEAYLKQIDAHDEYLRAMVSVAPRESLVTRAKDLDQERKEGRSKGPLHGIPIIIKDTIATHPSLGMETSAGSFALRDSTPKRNAGVVDKLQKAGMIILGKTNLSELSNFKGNLLPSGWSAVRGQTQSAYVRGGVDPSDSPDGHSSPSGSSTGSAVGVSAGYAPVAIGAETDGSLVVPAGRAALYALKPTVGLLETSGMVPVAHTFDTLGPLAKTPYDLGLILDVLVSGKPSGQGSYVSALDGSWKNISVATLDPDEWKFPVQILKPAANVTTQINREIRAACTKIQAQARSYVANASLISIDEFGESKQLIVKADFANDINAYLADLETSPVRTLKDLITFNKDHADVELPPGHDNQGLLQAASELTLSPKDYKVNFDLMRRVGKDRGLDYTFEKYSVDVLIGPTDSWMSTYAAAAGYPIATMPLGYLDYNGRPFGLCAIAKANQESLLLKVQSAWEATFGPRLAPPLLGSGKK